MKKVIFILFAICLSTFALKAQSSINKIEVVGEAEIEVAPDYFEYSINLQEYFKAENEKVSIETLEKALVKAVEELGFKKDRLTINSVNGMRNYSPNGKPNSFLESRNYVLRINSINDINNLLPKLDKLGLSGASMNKKSTQKKSEIEKELRTKSIQDSKEKASSIAKSVGKKVGDIILIQESKFYNQSLGLEELFDLGELTSYKVGYGNFNTDIKVEKIKQSYSVRITFQMK
jgi:uncharacterized protein YggE